MPVVFYHKRRNATVGERYDENVQFRETKSLRDADEDELRVGAVKTVSSAVLTAFHVTTTLQILAKYVLLYKRHCF